MGLAPSSVGRLTDANALSFDGLEEDYDDEEETGSK